MRLTIGLVIEGSHLTAEHPEGGGVIVTITGGDASGRWVDVTQVTCERTYSDQ